MVFINLTVLFYFIVTTILLNLFIFFMIYFAWINKIKQKNLAFLPVLVVVGYDAGLDVPIVQVYRAVYCAVTADS
jgi:hypothetical protein